jgi:hypothetical protein
VFFFFLGGGSFVFCFHSVTTMGRRYMLLQPRKWLQQQARHLRKQQRVHDRRMKIVLWQEASESCAPIRVELTSTSTQVSGWVMRL